MYLMYKIDIRTDYKPRFCKTEAIICPLISMFYTIQYIINTFYIDVNIIPIHIVFNLAVFTVSGFDI